MRQWTMRGWNQKISAGVASIFIMTQAMAPAMAYSNLRPQGTRGNADSTQQIGSDPAWIWGAAGSGMAGLGEGNLVGLGRSVVGAGFVESRAFSLLGPGASSTEGLVDDYATGYESRLGASLSEEQRQTLGIDIETVRSGMRDALEGETIEIPGAGGVELPLEQVIRWVTIFDEWGDPALVAGSMTGNVGHSALIAYAGQHRFEGWEAVTPEAIRRQFGRPKSVYTNFALIKELLDLGDEGREALKLLLRHEAKDAMRGSHENETQAVQETVDSAIARVMASFDQADVLATRQLTLSLRRQVARRKAAELTSRVQAIEMRFDVGQYFHGAVPSEVARAIQERLAALQRQGAVSEATAQVDGRDVVISAEYSAPQPSPAIYRQLVELVAEVVAQDADAELLQRPSGEGAVAIAGVPAVAALPSALTAPRIVPEFETALDLLVLNARTGLTTDSEGFNPSDEALVAQMRIFQDLSAEEQQVIVTEWEELDRENEALAAQGLTPGRAGPEVVFRRTDGGLSFYSQRGVVRRPDLTHYFVDGFTPNRDANSFSEDNQELFAEIFPIINRFINAQMTIGENVIQTDRLIGDAPGRALHARQLLFGRRYLQLPYMWKQLTQEMPEVDRSNTPDILEVSLPAWREDIANWLAQEGTAQDQAIWAGLMERVAERELTQLVFRAPTKDLSFHLGFDYVGEHKMGPLTIGMFKVKEEGGLAVQAALSVARVRTIDGQLLDTSMVTIGPSLHGKSTMTIMLELNNSELSQLLGIESDPEEGVYPMNDDIVMLRPVDSADRVHGESPLRIDGTEDNFYAVPFNVTQEDDPITFAALHGMPNENVPMNIDSESANFMENPTRNMRAIVSRQELLDLKGGGARHILEAITDGATGDSITVPMEKMEQHFWQSVMRRSDIIPPLARLTKESFTRSLMFGEAVQQGAAIGAIGRPYVEYFSDPFIMGLEDEYATRFYDLLRQMEESTFPNDFFVFNTGGIGSDTNETTAGDRYRKIPRELTLLLQEAVLRGAVRFEHDPVLGVDVAVEIVNAQGDVVKDLREWLPSHVYGSEEYAQRVNAMKHRRYYGLSASDRAGILRYTKVKKDVFNIADIPAPQDERDLAWLLSFYWSLDEAQQTLEGVRAHLSESDGVPTTATLGGIHELIESGLAAGLELPTGGLDLLRALGIELSSAALAQSSYLDQVSELRVRSDDPDGASTVAQGAWTVHEPLVSEAVIDPDTADQAADLEHPTWRVIHSSLFMDGDGSEAILFERLLGQIKEVLEGGESAIRFALVVDHASTPEEAERFVEAIFAAIPTASKGAARLSREDFDLVLPSNLSAQRLVDLLRVAVPNSRIESAIGPTAWVQSVQRANREAIAALAIEPAQDDSPSGVGAKALLAGIAAKNGRVPPALAALLDLTDEGGLLIPKSFDLAMQTQTAFLEMRERRRDYQTTMRAVSEAL